MAEIPQQRLVFFVKHIISQVSKGISSLAIKTEILKILKVVLPPIKEIYDNFWARVIELVRESWIFNTQISDDEIPNLHASLRLFSTLKRLSAEESNDDLQDTWTDEKGSLFEGLLGLLKKLQGISLNCSLQRPSAELFKRSAR